MGKRRQARELALQALYLADAANMDAQEAFKIVSIGPGLDGKTEDFARTLTIGAALHKAEIDELIGKVAENWEVQRMACVDRNLLRLASYELLHCPETPVSVVIDEALEIGKRFSSEDSSRFLNGILDKVKNAR
jgi:N utilization substance protein B